MNVAIRVQGKRMFFRYGDECIAFDRVHGQLPSNKVRVKVHPDCRVTVSAPAQADNDAVLAAVRKRARWIYEQLRNFRNQLEHVTPRKYISGESHYYLGKQYQLKVIESPGEAQGVKFLKGRLEVSVRNKSADVVRDLLVSWYKARAKEVFTTRLRAVLDQAFWVGEQPPIRILTMRTQWGSCSPNGRITLNPHLVKAPRDCIDYVILHELCHLAEHNHSERFYRLMTQVMPTWEKTKERLDGMANIILV